MTHEASVTFGWVQTAPEHVPDGASVVTRGAWTGVGCCGDLRGEYESVVRGAGLCDRSYRGLLEVTGGDRASWLHNLTTNQVKDLQVGDGNYSFVVNVQGRILFDAGILVREDSIWLDVEVSSIPAAVGHLEKYVVIEDVRLLDRSGEYVRFALVGPGAAAVLGTLGASHATSSALWQVGRVLVDGVDVAFFRQDFCGVDALDLVVPRDGAGGVWSVLSSCDGVGLVGFDAVDARRIEAGVPWSGAEIDDTVLPAETGQLERAVSFTKGCYLGQEIIARMASRGSLARQLVMMRFDGDCVPPVGASVRVEEGEAGRVTSSCVSPVGGCPMGLGYARTALVTTGGKVWAVWDGGEVVGEVHPVSS